MIQYHLRFSLRDWRIIRHAVRAYLNALEVQGELTAMPAAGRLMVDRLRYVDERLTRMETYPRKGRAA